MCTKPGFTVPRAALRLQVGQNDTASQNLDYTRTLLGSVAQD